MPRSLRLLGRPPAASEPDPKTAPPTGPEQPATGRETTARAQGDIVEVEDGEGRIAASDPQRHRPAPAEGVQALEGPDWRKEFDSPEELYARFKNVDRVRGRHASEVGQLRRQVGLYERTIRLLLLTRDPFERQALIQAAGLLHEPSAQASIERLVALGEQAHEQENSYAI